MKSPKVSITLSAYNIEKYIADSLDCIINQTLKDIEIICIDDGSEDNTLAILQEYAAKDNRMIVIAKPKNEGLAVARNQALSLAKGKYITFVDGDDLFDLTMLEKAYNLAENENADLVLWDYTIFYNNKDLKRNKQKSSSLKKEISKDKYTLLKRPAFTWIKLIKTEKARELGIYFPNGLTRQDIPVHWHLITLIDKISILPERLSYYRQQKQATTAGTDKRLFDLATVMDITQNFLLKKNLYSIYKNIFLENQLNLLYGMYNRANKEILDEAKTKIMERLSKQHWEYIYSSLPLRSNARSFYKAMNGSLFHKVKLNIFYSLRTIYRITKKL